MLFQTMNEADKKQMKKERQRKNSECMSSESSGSDSDNSSGDSPNRVPLMKMTCCDVDDLEWNLETGTLKEYLSDPEMD